MKTNKQQILTLKKAIDQLHEQNKQDLKRLIELLDEFFESMKPKK